jgi:hypothetical protein
VGTDPDRREKRKGRRMAPQNFPRESGAAGTGVLSSMELVTLLGLARELGLTLRPMKSSFKIRGAESLGLIAT